MQVIHRSSVALSLSSLSVSPTTIYIIARPFYRRFIANAANQYLSPNGGGANAAIYKAAGPQLDEDTKAKYFIQPHSPAQAGTVYPVQLSPDSPLHKKEGVEWVFHVLAPNMSKSRPFCLHGDYTKGCSLLRSCYSAMLSCFAAVTEDGRTILGATHFLNGSNSIDLEEDEEAIEPPAPRAKPSPSPTRSTATPAASKAFSLLMASKAPAPTKPQAKATKGGWSDLLVPYVRNPEAYPPDAVYDYDEETVVIFDKYPKAHKHLLVMPRQELGYSQLTTDHIPMLQALKKKGELVVKRLQGQYPNLVFRAGFHAIPSMRQLHMHLITQDFISEHLKTKTHWRSFTTAFFIPVDEFIAQLETQGQIQFDRVKYEAMLTGNLVCSQCTQTFQTMPKLKAHLHSHF
eukprot:TRINITY_DN2005_c0_g1_i5.p1 TRINITY_DN2005_c0_g1~~TRINITY_DN2005_c0_g1_i5.p1  ORF type:complete len:402 (+),score=21.73 TRINITY_DN2005_c0_g1_i5:754-1959(+)